MHLAVLILLSLAAIAVLVGACLAWREVPRAPVGVQTAQGFYVIGRPTVIVPWTRPQWILWV